MKFNLKTIKKKLEEHEEEQNMFTFDDLQTEIEGLEKELKESLRFIEEHEPHKIEEKYLIKVILGETTK